MGVLREKIRLHAIFTKILANYISEEASWMQFTIKVDLKQPFFEGSVRIS